MEERDQEQDQEQDQEYSSESEHTQEQEQQQKQIRWKWLVTSQLKEGVGEWREEERRVRFKRKSCQT